MKQLPILFGHACLVMLFIVFALMYKGKQCKLAETDYIVNITDDSISVYHNDFSFVGKVKLQGQLDSLLIDDNQ
jgi:hypothetical protein